MSTNDNDAVKAARTVLAATIERRKRLEEEAQKAQQAHTRAAAVLSEASNALRAIVDRDAVQDADAAARLAETIRAGGDATLEGHSHDHAERLQAERRVAVAQGALDSLARDLGDATAAVVAAGSDVQAAGRSVIVAHRDSIAAELNAVVQHYLDLRHKLGGLMSVFAVPGTAETAKALASVERDYPPALHPQNFTAKAWAELQKALLVDSEAEYVPIAPSLQAERVDPFVLKQRELRKQQEAERAANAEKVAEETKGYTQVEMLAERLQQFPNTVAGS